MPVKRPSKTPAPPLRRLARAILAALALAALPAAAKTYDVDVATGRASAADGAFYHGETVVFRPVRGREPVTNIEFSCVYYQTNGMTAWWKTDTLAFHPTNDVGASAYRFFIEGRDDAGRDWHANGTLRMLPSPGFQPNVLQLPVATLDYATLEVLNAPWAEPSDVAAATNAVAEEISRRAAEAQRETAASTNALAAVAHTGSYADLSGKPAIPTVPTDISAFVNNAGYVDETVTNALSRRVDGIASTVDVLVTNAATIADATLAPFDCSGWTITPATNQYGSAWTMSFGDEGEGLEWLFVSDDYPVHSGNADTNATVVTGVYYDYEDNPVTLTATRMCSYVLGSQADKPLASAARLAAATNAVAAEISRRAAEAQRETAASTNALAAVAHTGSYSDLSGKPTIPTVPTAVSAFSNDAGYLTQHQSLESATNYTDSATNALDTTISARGYLTQHQSLDGYATTNALAEQKIISQRWQTSVNGQLMYYTALHRGNILSPSLISVWDWALQQYKPTYGYQEITNPPPLAAVATSGSYSDLSGTPTIPATPADIGAASTNEVEALTRRIDALEAALAGLESALHLVNTGTNLVSEATE